MVYAQPGQQPLARSTETSVVTGTEMRDALLFERAASCVLISPTATAAQPEVACVRGEPYGPSIL